MPEHRTHGFDKPMSSKRRRVRFADDPTPVSKASDSKSFSKSKRKDSEDAKWKATPTDASRASLIGDASVDHGVTTFDLKEELREGKLCGEDGIIPNELIIDEGSSSSGDEMIPKKKRRRELDEDNDSDDDEESETLSLPDAIVEVLSVLKHGQTSADIQTPAARVLASSDLADLKRENLLALVPKWLLCWSAPGTRTHGPFKTSEMLTWARARYFIQPNRVGLVCPLGGRKWARACDVFSSDQNE